MDSIGARMGGSQLGQKTKYMQDTMAHIPPAGKVTSITGEGTARCLQHDERPTTPPEIRRYRQSVAHEPGRIVRHPGRVVDPVHEGPFGRETIQPSHEAVSECIKQLPNSDLLAWKLERQEDIYASKKREPLGKSMVRGHNIPDQLKETGFGRTINAKELNTIGQAHQIIFPADGAVEEDEAVRTMYMKTHGDYEPGQQRRRGYDWEATGVDPDTHAFGAVDKVQMDSGVAKALNPDLDSATAARTEIIDKGLADFKITNTDYLGTTKNLGHGDRRLPENHSFGKPTRTFVEWDAGRLIHGDYSEEEQQPDGDLGRSLRPGYRNMTTDHRAFGTPSIRTDLPNPKGQGTIKGRSIADNTNYGNEPTASHLLTPGIGADRGIGEEHYVELLGKDAVDELVQMSGIQFADDAAFDESFYLACQLCGSSDMCSLEAILQAKEQILRRTAGLL